MKYKTVLTSILILFFSSPLHGFSEEGFEILLNAYYDRDYMRIQGKNPYEVEIKCQNIDFSEMDLSDMDLSYAECINCDFRGCKLHNTKFDHAVLKGCSFDDCFLKDEKFVVAKAVWRPQDH